MKVLCDVHIARKITRFLQNAGVDAVHINDLLNGDRTKDGDIADYATANEYVVLTKDKDFKNSHLIKGKPKMLLKINLGNLSTAEIIKRLEDGMALFDKHFDSNSCCIEINPGNFAIIK